VTYITRGESLLFVWRPFHSVSRALATSKDLFVSSLSIVHEKFLAPTTDIYVKVKSTNIKKVVTILLSKMKHSMQVRSQHQTTKYAGYALRMTVEHASTA
jgi:hypothetical protein